MTRTVRTRTTDIPKSLWEMENFANAYRNWLVYAMHGEDHRILFDILYDTEFYWILPEDEHRAASGRYLRERFEAETGLECKDEWVDWPCSFLEMMAGLAYSMEGILYDPDKSPDAYIWFWMMMGNLGLAELTDDVMLASPQSTYRYVNSVCLQVCNRTYDRNGFGGIFPLNSPPEDQRNVELWYQMQSYIMEKQLF